MWSQQGGAVARDDGFLERSQQISALAEAHREVRAGHGVLALVSGEAGSGKTTLVRRFCQGCTSTVPILWGTCDPLFTPRPLGPVMDIAEAVGGPLGEAVRAGAAPHEIAAEFMRLSAARPGSVVVFEDLHWADEATLDILTLLGRRMVTVPALIVATYRDDEVDRGHPLRNFLAHVQDTSTVRRLRAERLSPQAVATLADRSDVDAAMLHRVTSGNAFFVTEVLAAGREQIPATVRDAVLARAARLGNAAGALLEAVSIAVPHAEPALLDALVDHDGGALQRCLDSGILHAVDGAVAFRHELARRAFESSLSPHLRKALHLRALRALAGEAAPTTDLARLAHHAEAAGDTEAVLRFAPAAAEQAESICAHRESAAQYARALRFGARLAAQRRAAMLEARSYACYLTDQIDDSVQTLREAIVLRRAEGDSLGEGAALSTLARRLGCAALAVEAETAARQATELLETLPAGPQLALAYSNLAQVGLNDERTQETLRWSARALELAERFGAEEAKVHSLNNIGTMRLLAGRGEGWALLQRSLQLAEQSGLHEHIGRAYLHFGWAMTRTRRYVAPGLFDEGVARCEDLGLEGWRLHLLAYRARFLLDSGRWAHAADAAASLLRAAGGVPLLRILALTILGLVRARRGDAEVWPPLDEALALARNQRELQYTAPVAAARAEAAWLQGRDDDVEEATTGVLAVAVQRESCHVAGELAWLRRLAGIAETPPRVAEPYCLQFAGDTAAAAQWWSQHGCSYDAALALAHSDDEQTLRRAVAQFQALRAAPAAALIMRRLRRRGVNGVPRGPRPATRDNPAQLTRREVDVVGLIQHGASNAEIAARLFLSEKTVHHHVTAILRKLGATGRHQAGAMAAQLGITPQAKAPADDDPGVTQR